MSNIVLVKKKFGKWCMCVDYTNLHNLVPDSSPLLNIRKLVCNLAEHNLLLFMYAYSRYNLILINEKVWDKTTFMTKHANYIYNVIPFVLKNAGARFQMTTFKFGDEYLHKSHIIGVFNRVLQTT